MKKEYKVEVVKEGALGTIFFWFKQNAINENGRSDE